MTAPSSSDTPSSSPATNGSIVDQLRSELIRACDDAADERLVTEVAMRSARLSAKVNEAAVRVLAQVPVKVLGSDAKDIRPLVGALKDLVGIANGLNRRVENALQVAAALRAQRRLRERAAS